MGKTEKRSGQGSMADWFICQEIAQFQRAYGRGETLPASPPPAPPPEPLEEKWHLLEEAEPVDVLTFIESPQYLNKRDEIYDSAKWVLEIFYHPERHHKEFD